MSEWKKVKIGDFLLRYKKPVDIKDSVAYRRITIRIKHNGISLRDEAIGKKIGTKKQFTVKGGQFLLSKIDARYGAFGIVPKDLDEAIITGNFWAYDVNSKLVNIDWLNQYTNSPDFYNLCERSSSGITHRKYLNEKTFLNFEILIPSIEEQKTIVDKNKTIECKYIKLVSENKVQAEYINNLRQAILQDAIQGKLTEDWRKDNPDVEPAAELLKKIKAEKEKLIKDKKIKKEKPLSSITKEEIPFDLPKGWEWCRLGELCHLITDGTHHTPHYVKDGIHFLSVRDVAHGIVDLSNTKYISKEEHKILTKRCNPEFGDLLLTKVGTTGIAKVIDVKADFSLFVSVALLKFNQGFLYNYFLENLINSPLVKKQSQSGTKGMGNQNLVIKTIKDFIVPLPPHKEQVIIVQKIDKLIGKLNKLELEIKQNKITADLLMQSVLREAFSK